LGSQGPNLVSTKVDRDRERKTLKLETRDALAFGGTKYPPGKRARPAARASPRLLGIASAACFGAPLGLACRLCTPAACTCQMPVCLLRAPPTGGTHSASRTRWGKISAPGLSLILDRIDRAAGSWSASSSKLQAPSAHRPSATEVAPGPPCDQTPQIPPPPSHIEPSSRHPKPKPTSHQGEPIANSQ
jgi:hypothetical protein